MITEKDLQEAIAECKGTRNPNASTCIKLAAYYTILDNLYPKEEHFADVPRNDAVIPLIQSESEFIRICSGKDIKSVLIRTTSNSFLLQSEKKRSPFLWIRRKTAESWGLTRIDLP